MNESTQKTGLSSKQWFILLIAFLMGVASVFTLDKLVPAQGSSNHVVQASPGNR